MFCLCCALLGAEAVWAIAARDADGKHTRAFELAGIHPDILLLLRWPEAGAKELASAKEHLAQRPRKARSTLVISNLSTLGVEMTTMMLSGLIEFQKRNEKHSASA